MPRTFARIHAKDVVARINGVEAITNRLDLSYDAPEPYDYGDWDAELYDDDFDHVAATYRKSDSEIAEEIEGELFWSPFVDAGRIAVTVDDGVATLTGTVEDVFERRKATENALEGGAYRVLNGLEIR